MMPNSSAMEDPSLVVIDGHMYVAGHVGTVPVPGAPQRIRYLTDVTGDWTFENFRGSRSPSLVIDENGNPQIAAQRHFQAGEDGFVWSVIHHRGTSPTGGFRHKTIVEGIDLAGNANIALSTGGRPRIAWSEPDGVHYAVKANTGWSEELVAVGLTVTDLVIDPLGMAHMTASDGSRLWYLTGPQNGGTGDFEIVDVAAASAASDFDIDVAADGRVDIAFQRGDNSWWVRSRP